MSYGILRSFLLAFLVIYTIVGLMTRYVSEKYVYPFYSWSLFPEIPNTIEEYTLIFRPIDEPAVWFKDGATRFFTLRHSPTAHWDTIQLLGKAVEIGDTKAIKALQSDLESDFVSLSTPYDIAKIRYNPLTFWQCGKIESTKILKQIFIDSL